MKPPYKSKNVQKKTPLRESKRNIDRKKSIVKVPVLNLEPSVADVEKIYSDLVTKKEAYAEHFEKPSFLSRLKKYTKKALSNRGVQLALGVATVGLALTLREQFKKYKEKEKALLQAFTICDFFNDDGAFKIDVFEVQDFENKQANLIKTLEDQVSMVTMYISDQTSSWNTTILIEEKTDKQNFFPNLKNIELKVGKLNVAKLNKIDEYKHPSSQLLNLLEPFSRLINDVNLFMKGIDELKKHRDDFLQILHTFKIIVSCEYDEQDNEADIEKKLETLNNILISQEKILYNTILYQNELTLDLTIIIKVKESIISNLNNYLNIIKEATTEEEKNLLKSIQKRNNTVNEKIFILKSILDRFDNNDVKEEELVIFEEEQLETRRENFNIDLESINNKIKEYNGLVKKYNDRSPLYIATCENFKKKVIEIIKVTEKISTSHKYTYTQSKTLKENDEALKIFISQHFSGSVITDSFFQGDIKTLTYLHDTEIKRMTNMIDRIRENLMNVFYDFLKSESESFNSEVALQLQKYYSKDSIINIELYSALQDAIIKSATCKIHDIKYLKTITSKEKRWKNDVDNILIIKNLSGEIDSVYIEYKLEKSITEYIETNIKKYYEELFKNAVFVKIEDNKIEIIKSTDNSSNSIPLEIIIVDESDLKKKYDEFETRLYIFLASKLLWKGLRDEKNKCDSILKKQKKNPNLASFVDSVIEEELNEELKTYEKDESSNNFMSATFTEEYLTKIHKSLQSFKILQGELNSTVKFMETVDSFYKEKSKWPFAFLFGNKNILEELFEKVKSHLNSLVPSPLVYDFVPKSYLGPFKSYLEPVLTVDKKFIKDVESLIGKTATLPPEKTKHVINPNFLRSLIFLLNITQQDVSSLSSESTTQILKILFSIYSKIIMDVVNENKVHGFKYKDKVIKDLPSDDNILKIHLQSLTEALIEMVFDDYSEFKKFSTSTFIFPLHESKFTSFSDVERQKLIDFTENCIYISSYEKDFITLDLNDLIDMGFITQEISDNVKTKLSKYISEAKNILMLKDSQTDSLKKVEKITKVIKEEMIEVEKGHIGLDFDITASFTRSRNWSKDLITSYQSEESTHLIHDELLFLDSFIHTRSLMTFIDDEKCTESPESCYAEIHKQVKTPLYTELENKRKKYYEVVNKSYDTYNKWKSTQFGFISDQFFKVYELYEVFILKDYVAETRMPMYNNVTLKEVESLNNGSSSSTKKTISFQSKVLKMGESKNPGDKEKSAKTIDEAEEAKAKAKEEAEAKAKAKEEAEAAKAEAEAEAERLRLAAKAEAKAKAEAEAEAAKAKAKAEAERLHLAAKAEAKAKAEAEAERLRLAAKAKAVDNFIQSSKNELKSSESRANRLKDNIVIERNKFFNEFKNKVEKLRVNDNIYIGYIVDEMKKKSKKMSGYGIIETIKGNITKTVESIWDNDKSIELYKLTTLYINADLKSLYEGFYDDNGKMSGYMMAKVKNTTYEGYYKNDFKEGYGELKENNILKYIGYWKNGKRDGVGIEYSSDGNISYSGYWSEGKQQSDIDILSKYDTKELYFSIYFKNGGSYTIKQLPTGLHVSVLVDEDYLPGYIQNYDGLKYSFKPTNGKDVDGRYFDLEDIKLNPNKVDITTDETNKIITISNKSMQGGKITQKKIKTKQKRSSSKKMVFKHLGARNLVV
jgi:hypothetical protein